MNKKKILNTVISSVIILLPMLFGIIMWHDLPDNIITHWGADGNADGFGGKVFAVFGLPCILLVLHLICLLFTLIDKKQKEQDPKALGIIFWIIPVVSLFSNGMMYRAAFGKEVDFSLFVPVLLGVLFIFMGNYFPKIKQNKTLGIKISWTMNNEENWNKTHRFSGKLWVIGGFIILFSIFVPSKITVWILLCVLTVSVIAPFIYSYCIYRQHQKQGIEYSVPPKSKAEKITLRISAVVVTVILIGAAVSMFTGNIDVHCEDNSFNINASYWTDIEINYSEIDSIEYRIELDTGVRTNGFGSARLAMGTFQNKEFGSYTLYAYTGAEEYIVLTSKGKTLVIGLLDAKDTRAIYDAMSEKISG